jgi:hypothetical protein
MWQNYIDVIHEYCSEAVIVFDPKLCANPENGIYPAVILQTWSMLL